MPRIIAYPFVAFMAVGVIGATWLLVWMVTFDGKAGDLKGIAATLGFIVWWSWAGISVYSHYIKKPREEKKQRCAEAAQVIEKAIAPDSSLTAAIRELSGCFPLVGEPRHRDSPDPTFDTLVQLETEDFIISLFGRDGLIKTWSVR